MIVDESPLPVYSEDADDMAEDEGQDSAQKDLRPNFDEVERIIAAAEEQAFSENKN